MDSIQIILPEYTESIIKMVEEADWIIDLFEQENIEYKFNPAYYNGIKILHGIEFHAFIDLNLLQFLSGAVKKTVASSFSRVAIAHVVFCQLAEILIDPTIAVYEKVNYSDEKLADSINDLELFYQIDSGANDDMASYAMGGSESFRIDTSKKVDKELLREKIMEYQRLRDWQSLYLIMLVIIKINNDPEIAKEDKLKELLNWLIYDYRKSIVSVVYAIYLYSNNPLKRMMKYKKGQSKSEKKDAVHNMVWDLYFMDSFLKKWTDRPGNLEIMLISGDKALGKMLRTLIDLNFKHPKDLFPNMSVSDIDALCWYLEVDSTGENRKYQSSMWGVDYRDSLIKENEKFVYAP